MRYATANDCVPEPCFIAGTRMLPFCLGHHLLFRRLGLPFAGSPDADCGMSDLLAGIHVCARTYEDTLQMMHAGTWVKSHKKWMRKVSIWGSFQEATPVEFREYLKTGYAMPPTWKHSKGSGINYSAPWEELLKMRLVLAGFSESEALNGYLPCRWYDYFTAIEITAADNCIDPKTWRQIFVTHEEASKLEEARRGA